MAPKPFQPPRPAGRPKGSTSAGRKSTSTSTPISKPKSKPGSKPISKRPSTSTSKAKQPRTSAASTILSPSIGSPSSQSDPFDSDHAAENANAADEMQQASGEEEEEHFEDRTQHIPQDLLARLLHEFFRDEGTRIHKDANNAVGRYVETFVREALARAVFLREEMEGGKGGGSGGGGMVEVEDLEKLAPQLLLDF